MKRFSEDHVWVDVRHGVGTVGISSYAAEELGEITFVELPEIGTVFAQGEPLCVIESTKTASDVISPVGGTVREVNIRLEQNPGQVNRSPEQDAWICRLDEIAADDLEALMTEEEYESFLEDDADE